VRFLVRLVLLPFRLVIAAVVVSFRTGLFVARVPVRASAGVGRAVGLRAAVALLVGVAIGLLLAPVPGRELRRRLQEWLAPPPTAVDAVPGVAAVEAEPG